jgi:hypothetical protein
MNCVNHQDVPALSVCVACADAFCEDCLVDIQGQKYCGSCKVVTVRTPPPPLEGTIDCQEANDALRYAIFGIFCLGIILEPVALSKAATARQRIADDPRLAGSGKLTATYVIAIVVLAFWVIGILGRVAAR